MADVTVKIIVLTTLLFNILISVTAYGNPPLLDRACRSTRNYRYCLAALSSDPTSKTTNIHGLVAIAARLTTEKANATVSYIEPISKNNEARCIEYCRDAYNSAVDAGNRLESSLKDNDKGGAMKYLKFAQNEVRRYCKEECINRPEGTDKNVLENLYKRSEDFRIMCGIALSITNLLP